MPRLSIDISAQDHQQLKAIAALKGQSIKEYVLSRTLADVPSAAEMTDEEALTALKQLLSPRIDEAIRGDVSMLDMQGVIAEAKNRKSSN